MNSYLSILLFWAILFLIFHFVAVWVEEPGLEKRFGNGYVVYKADGGKVDSETWKFSAV